MNRRLLYILIIILVLAVAIFVVRPMLAKKSAAPVPAAHKKATDTSAVAAKAKRNAPATKVANAKPGVGAASQPRTAAKGKTGKTGKGGAAQPATPEAAAQPEVAMDTTPLTWQSDPFVRDWMLAGELRDLKVRAVTLGDRPLALINDRIVSLNDTISGKRVATITRDSVVFEFGGQRRSLKIGE